MYKIIIIEWIKYKKIIIVNVLIYINNNFNIIEWISYYIIIIANLIKYYLKIYKV